LVFFVGGLFFPVIWDACFHLKGSNPYRDKFVTPCSILPGISDSLAQEKTFSAFTKKFVA